MTKDIMTVEEFIKRNKTEDLCFELDDELLTDDIDEFCEEKYNDYNCTTEEELEFLKASSDRDDRLIKIYMDKVYRLSKALDEIEELACCIKNFNFGYDELGIGQDIIAYADDILDIINKVKDRKNE